MKKLIFCMIALFVVIPTSRATENYLLTSDIYKWETTATTFENLNQLYIIYEYQLTLTCGAKISIESPTLLKDDQVHAIATVGEVGICLNFQPFKTEIYPPIYPN